MHRIVIELPNLKKMKTKEEITQKDNECGAYQQHFGCHSGIRLRIGLWCAVGWDIQGLPMACEESTVAKQPDHLKTDFPQGNGLTQNGKEELLGINNDLQAIVHGNQTQACFLLPFRPTGMTSTQWKEFFVESDVQEVECFIKVTVEIAAQTRKDVHPEADS
ncbi:unnamed protein product [Dibothriocephalus latus]|uniref:Uncharacterized protein n=1 Tax=Dibothriocephalus latus TaxID=60516 RepID=A0A3P7LGE9_DIBLA|nr:unnamed protein product [Dibothriocephalus latus]